MGPESDHRLCLSLTDWLTHWLTDSCLVNLIDVTLACEDTNSKLDGVVTVADVDDEDRVGNSLLQISKPRFGFVEVVKLNLGQYSEARFGQDFEAYDLWRGWCLVEILKFVA